MNWKTLTAVLSALAVVLAGGWLVMRPHAVGAATGSIPTFSTAEIGREGHFYVGGHYVGEPGDETMHGAMYVETWVPKKIRHPYPIVIIGFSVGQNEYEFMQTPDGRPGWAYDFVNRGLYRLHDGFSWFRGALDISLGWTASLRRSAPPT